MTDVITPKRMLELIDRFTVSGPRSDLVAIADRLTEAQQAELWRGCAVMVYALLGKRERETVDFISRVGLIREWGEFYSELERSTPAA